MGRLGRLPPSQQRRLPGGAGAALLWLVGPRLGSVWSALPGVLGGGLAILVAAGAAAARHANVSVLPVARGQASLPPVITARIAELDPDWVRVVGGPLAVPDQAVLEALAAAGVSHLWDR